MNAHTERRLDGHKLFVHQAGENVGVHAVTDGRPLTRLVFEMHPDEAVEIGRALLDAARSARRVTSPSAVQQQNNADASVTFGAGDSADQEAST